jgi:hypothetical protein
MIAEKLSKTVVERIKAADQDVVVWDNTLPGFGVRVNPVGSAATSSNIATGTRVCRGA